MRIRACFVVAVLAAAFLIPLTTFSKSTDKPVARGHEGTMVPRSIEEDYRWTVQRGLHRAPAAADTTFLAFFDFEGAGCDAQGWTGLDASTQAPYFHIDDFSALGGGTYNRLWPIEGNQSLWCGMRPTTDQGLCLYGTPPGYGNDWDQQFCTVTCLDVTGTVTVDYEIVWDTEPDYDWAFLEYDECDDNWRDFDPMVAYTGVDTSFESHSIPDTLHGGQVRIRFSFYSDVAWSDQDGIWNTDGALIVDSLTVRDGSGIVVPTELFEDEAVGSTVADNWGSCNKPPYGDFSALYPGIHMVQEDPCNQNYTCMWAFIAGSAYDYSCGGFPGQAVVPYEDGRGQYINNLVVSPLIPYAGSGNVVEMAFDNYGDLDLNALVFHYFMVRAKVGDCMGPWMRTGNIWYTSSGIPAWYHPVRSFGHMIPAGATHIQVALGVIDRCGRYCGYYGDGTCHSHSPMFDNVSVYRVASFGPHISAQRFGDGFPADGTLTGTVRADATSDISDDPLVLEYADDLWVGAEDPQGIAPDPHTGFGAAVYAYVSVRPQNQPGKSGLDLVDDAYRWPVVDSLVIDGNNWYQIRLDTAFFDVENRIDPWPGYWTFDLNDNLFTPGDTVFHFYSAQSVQAPFAVNYWTGRTGDTGDLAHAVSNADEFTCLPATGYQNGGDILLCIDRWLYYGSGDLIDDALRSLGLEDKVDRFNISGNCTPSGKIVDIYQQLLPCYSKILWLVFDDISDSGNNNKTDDFGLVNNFLQFLERPGGVYFASDQFAERLVANTSASAVTFRSSYLNFDLVNADHNSVGQPISPQVVGASGAPFYHTLGPDTMIAYGGCPRVNSFDVVAETGLSTVLANYGGDPNLGAVIGQKTTNTGGQQVGAMMSGFGYEFIRDDRATGILDRADHLRDILQWLGGVLDQPVSAEPEPFRNSLAQNHPNPFNPTTTIAFTVKEQGPVSLNVYNVAGQLVRTLVNDNRAPGLAHTIDWNGRNNRGQQVSSGVYFYKLVAKGFTKTKKMVLLK